MNDLAELTTFAKRYAKSWCSQNPQNVAAFFAENGSLSVNNGPPAVGRTAIAKEAQAFMITFPDMVVTFDKLEPQPNAIAFHWTLTGTNIGPGGTGKRVCISGYELWQFDNDGLIEESKGHFESAEYASSRTESTTSDYAHSAMMRDRRRFDFVECSDMMIFLLLVV
jgi:hypothetical protein